MSDGGDACICVLAVIAIGLIFMTVASPGFLLYGFFSGEWLIENRTVVSKFNITNNATIYYGLYRKCQDGICSSHVVDGKTFSLEVTSVVFQFLAILALPWLKPCVPDNKVLKYWNYCFVPLLFLAAIFSLSAGTYFKSLFDPKRTPHLSTGVSQACASLGGGFQIVLACIITGFFWHHKLMCFKPKSRLPTTYVQRSNENRQSMAMTSINRTENIFVAIFSYESVSVDGEVVAEQHVVAARVEEEQVAMGHGRQIARY